MRNSIREMYQYIKKIAFNKKISLETLLPAIHCYARSPQVTPEKMIHLLENIIKMIESGVDISCILEAGTFFGMSYDYIKFEQEKRIVSAERWKSEKIIEELEKMKSKLNGADKLLDIPFSMEIRDGIKTPSLIFNFDIKSLDGYYKSMYMDNKDFQIWCWNQLPESFKTIVTKLKRKKPFRKGKNFELLYQTSLNSFEQEIIDQLQAKIEIDHTRWHVDKQNFMNTSTFLTVSYREEPHSLRIAEDPDTPTSIGGTKTYWFDRIERNEIWAFVSIYQKHIFERNLFGIKDELKRFFVAQNGRTPNDTEYENLRYRYYRVIRELYSREMFELAEYEEKSVQREYIAGLPITTKTEPAIFYLNSRPYKKEEKINIVNHLRGKMFYDIKTDQCWLLPGSWLNLRLEQYTRNKFPTMKSFFERESKLKNIVKKTITLDEQEITFYSVRKKIKVPSATFAAQLVLGYKRNGLKCWKNNLNQTLEEYKASKESQNQ